MIVFLNGEQKEVKEEATLSEILSELKISTSSIAVAVNWECIPRSAHSATRLKPQDKIEILSPQQGG